MPLIYIPKSLANTTRPKVISAIRFCAYAPGEVSGPLSGPAQSSSSNVKMTNHWIIDLIISPTESIRFDPSPTGQNNSLDLIATAKDDASPDSVKSSHLTPAEGLTVGQVIDYIINSGYDRYQFSSSGQGCRYWLYSLANLLLSARYITGDTEVDAATNALQIVWTETGDRAADDQQTSMTQGTFY